MDLMTLTKHAKNRQNKDTEPKGFKDKWSI